MTDNVKLLKECDAGVKMGINGIAQVKDKASGENFVNLLDDYEKQHEKLYEIINRKLSECDEHKKDPNAWGEASAWASTNIKMMFNSEDEKIADLMIDGCNMGIKSVSKYMNKYNEASKEVMDIANDVVVLEQHFMNELRQYL
ncbi:MAG: hypothetical protein Q4G05_03605 [Clostridia bacterium]|nr:hypothetical protein [Clostridia bacterium]